MGLLLHVPICLHNTDKDTIACINVQLLLLLLLLVVVVVVVIVVVVVVVVNTDIYIYIYYCISYILLDVRVQGG